MPPTSFNPLSLLQYARRRSLPDKLSTARRINPLPRDPIDEDIDYTDIKRNHLSQLIHKAEGDGLWKCCNGHEQELIHYTGAYPFKYLNCERCAHVLCHFCCTTQIISPLQPDPNPNPKPTPKHTAKPSNDTVHFAQVCPECGLSHRLRLVQTTLHNHVLCACGRLADDKWLQFRIGSIDAYRRNPHAAFAELARLRAERSVYALQRRGNQLELNWSPLSPNWQRQGSSSNASTPPRSESMSSLAMPQSEVLDRGGYPRL